MKIIKLKPLLRIKTKNLNLNQNYLFINRERIKRVGGERGGPHIWRLKHLKNKKNKKNKTIK